MSNPLAPSAPAMSPTTAPAPTMSDTPAMTTPAAIPLPNNPFDPYIPDASAPFNLPRLSHLLRRTAFGNTPDRLDTFLPPNAPNKSPSDVLDSLFNYDPDNDPLNPLLDDLDGFLTLNKPELAQEWWLFRLFKTPRPFQERIALFWHNSFATALSKDQNPTHMVRQIDLFRRLGLANFRDLLLAVGRDPAMLIWLNGEQNRKGKPNENYAREVMELFTLGIGNYTENDVKEIARAFTGWRIKGNESVFDKSLFDDGEKTIFGQTGRFNDESVVDLILNHPACPKHIAYKLLREFVHPHPPQEVIDQYAARLLDNKWEIKPVLREMLASRLFFSDWAYRSKIKSPVDIVVGSINALIGMGGGKASVESALKQLNNMGESIMMPPNVKGWDGEEAWINANTLFVRYNFASSVVQPKSRDFTRPPALQAFLEKRDLTSADKILDYYTNLLLGDALPAPTRDKFLKFLNTTKDKPTPFSFAANYAQPKIRELLHLLMTMPEYQLS